MKIKIKFLSSAFAMLTIVLLIPASCSGTASVGSGPSANAPGSNAVTQSNEGSSTQSGLPVPDATESYLQTQVAQEQPLATPLPGTNSLVNTSLDDLARKVAATSRPRSGTAQVMLARRVTPAELTSMELYCYQSSTIETPPLALIIIKGDFPPDVQNANFTSNSPTISYIAYVFDLWAGAPTLVLKSDHGGAFRTALNDPTLPGDVPAGHPTPRPLSCSNTTSMNSKLYHYGDTLPGTLEGPNLVHQADFGAWSYSAIKEATPTEHSAEGALLATNQPYAQVRFNDGSSVAGIEKYIDANKQLVGSMSQRSGQVETWVVFKDYVPADQFRAFAGKYGLKTGISYLRAIDENPNPLYAPYYKLQVVPTDGASDPLPHAQVDSAFSQVQANVPQLTMKGVYATHAWVDARNLPALAADPSVYYVDLTANAVRDDLAKAGIAGADQAVVETPAALLFALVEKPWQGNR